MAPRRPSQEGGPPGTLVAAAIVLVGSMPGLAAGIAGPADATTGSPTAPPSKPRNLSAERGPYAVHLDWDRPEDGTAGVYEVQRRQGDGDWERVAHTMRTSYNDSSAPPPDPERGLEYKVYARVASVTPPEPVEEEWPFVSITNPKPGGLTTCGPIDLSSLTCNESLARRQTGLQTVTCETDRTGLSQEGGSPTGVLTCDTALVHGEAIVQATVLSPSRIEEVAFRVDGTTRHTVAEPDRGNEFEWRWEVHHERIGPRTLTVAALDAQGRRASQTMDVFTTRVSAGGDDLEADSWIEADGLGAGAALQGADTGLRGPATDEGSEGCAGANATLQYGDFEDEREAGRCLDEDPREGSVEVLLHGTVLELDLGSVTVGDLLAWLRGTQPAPYELRFAPETRLCAGAIVDAPPAGDEPVEATSCEGRPLAEGRYQVSLIVDGTWVNLTAPDRRFPPVDPGVLSGGEPPVPELPGPFPPSPAGLEDDSLRDGCYGARVHTPATGTVALVAGDACSHPERSPGG